MFRFLKGLFSNTADAEIMLNKGVSMLDDAVFTKQEKAVEKRKFLDKYIELILNSKHMSVARRVIAFLFVIQYMILINICVIGMIIGASWVTELKTALIDWIKQPVSIIVGFYFFQAIVKTGMNKS